MATKVLVPLLGEGVEEVTVTKWLKREGETIKEFEPLLEVNTDKVDTEIPAPASGTVLKIVAQEGAPARVGEVLALIGKPGRVDGIARQRVRQQNRAPTSQSPECLVPALGSIGSSGCAARSIHLAGGGTHCRRARYRPLAGPGDRP